MRRGKDVAPYANRRFAWKTMILQDPNISRGAKLFATCLCDTYVNKHTGACWPKNETVAKRLGVSKRSVQRYYRNLEVTGYLIHVAVGRTRRAHRINLPCGWGDSEDDNFSSLEVTEVASNRDTSVTPYKNQGKNKRNAASAKDMKYIAVGFFEKPILDGWEDWLIKNTDHDAEAVFNLLRKGEQAFLPARYPNQDETRRYQKFFEMVVVSNGKCFGG